MTMQSLQLLPALQDLPVNDDNRRSARQIVDELVRTDSALHAAEFTASVSFAMWGIWDEINVDDTLARAYKSQYPGLADNHSLHEQWLRMNEQGPESMQGFVSGLKGKVAEFDFAESLENQGMSVTFPDSANYPGIDFWVVFPDGSEVPVQVKSMAGGAPVRSRTLCSMTPASFSPIAANCSTV